MVISADVDQVIESAKSRVVCLRNENLGLVILCQGSKKSSGRKSAELAAETIQEFLTTNKQEIDKYNSQPSPLGRFSIETLLRKALQQGHESVLKGFKEDMPGISVEVLLALKDYAFLAHVGTNRVILIRNEHVEDVIHRSLRSHDPLELGFKIDESAIPIKNASTTLLGNGKDLRVDVQPMPIAAGDILLLLTLESYEDLNLKPGKLEKHIVSLINGSPEKIKRNLGGLLRKKSPDSGVAVVSVGASMDGFKKDSLDKQFSILNNIAIFIKFRNDKENLNRIHSLTTRKFLKKGDVIMREGEPSDAMYIVLSGSLDVYQRGQYVYNVAEGYVAGEIGLLNEEPRSFTVEAAGKAEIMIVKKDALLTLMGSDREMERKLFQGLVHDLSTKVKLTLTEKADRSLRKKVRK